MLLVVVDKVSQALALDDAHVVKTQLSVPI